MWYTIGKLLSWGFWKHIIQYVCVFANFCQNSGGKVQKKFQNHHRIKCDTPLESWWSEVSLNILYNTFAFLIFFSKIPVVGWWSSKSANEAQFQLMELKVTWWSSSGADGGYYIRTSLLLIALFLSTVCAVHRCLHSLKAVGRHSRWSFRPLVLSLIHISEPTRPY